MTESSRTKGVLSRGVSWRAIVLAVILIPFNAIWIQSMELVWDSGMPTAASFFFNALFILFVLALINLLLRRWLPRWALEPGELVVVYVMLCVASAIGGHDFLEVLVTELATFTYYASPENRWEEVLSGGLPRSLIVTDQRAVNSFWEGGGYLYSWEALRPWVVPGAIWIGFVLVLVGVMMGLNLLVWRRWNDQERLSYPLIQLPTELTRPGLQLIGKELLGNKLLWIGFGIAGAIDVLNGFAYLYPSVPSLHVTYTAWTPKQYPWAAMGWTAMAIYPFAIGLGYMMPPDFIFSCWFFYWFWKAQMLMGYFIGQVQQTSFPYVAEQTFGAYAGVGIFALWTGRHYFIGLLRSALGGRDVPDESRSSSLHRLALVVVGIGFALIVVFANSLMGIGIPVVLLFFGGYLLISLSITRMRAEFGLPVHDFFTGPLAVMVGIAGPRAIGQRNLIPMSLFFWLVRVQRSHPMPHGLEGLTLGERRGLPTSGMLVAITIAIVLGAIAGYWSMLHLGYTHSFIRSTSDASFLAKPAFQRTMDWLTYPRPPHAGRLGGLLGGAALTIGLMLMRQRFVWWPFHPAGYAASSMMFMGLLWLPMLVAWIIKSSVLRYGGHKLYRSLLPFFMGVILGEFFVGGLWGVIGTVGGFATYRFWPY